MKLAEEIMKDQNYHDKLESNKCVFEKGKITLVV